MPKILKVNTPADYSRYHGLTNRHPLITLIEYSRISPVRHSLNSYGVYGIFYRTTISISHTVAANTTIATDR